jgi:hypothetical protein
MGVTINGTRTMRMGHASPQFLLLPTCEEIRKIRLSDTGMFTVRSAYKIALQHEQEEQRQVGSSIRADGQ